MNGRVRNSGLNAPGVRRNRPHRAKTAVAQAKKVKAEPAAMHAKVKAEAAAASPQAAPARNPNAPASQPPLPPSSLATAPAEKPPPLPLALVNAGFKAAVAAARAGSMDLSHNGSVQAAFDRAVRLGACQSYVWGCPACGSSGCGRPGKTPHELADRK